MNTVTIALVSILGPAVAAALSVLLPALRRRGRPSAILSLGAAFATLAAALALAYGQLQEPARVVVREVEWLRVDAASLGSIGVRIDGISASMLVVVSFVALCVQVFSLGYMRGEPPPAFGRYFALHALFLLSMNVLVLAPNLLQLFIGWELVGTTSYLLIGFYFRKASAARAALKAFWVTKFADMGLLGALLILQSATGGFGWNAALAPATASAVTLLLFLAVVGKSAQFPLHVWLPDAMEGPTPVSALLHAATMVAAGVFLVVRANPLFVQAPGTLLVMAHLGALTALFAALVACFQTDIKKVLAYSTCSQLGYMVAALGAGSLVGGFFHLTTHAFFKALLFLSAGSVIHAVHSNELRDMGGLRRRMPLTTVAFSVGALSLAGIPGFAGFFSKDVVLEAVAERGLWLPYGALLASVLLTALYAGRVVLLAFFGAPSEAASHAHESPRSMALPLLLLAVPSLGVGWLGATLGGLYGADGAFHASATAGAASALSLTGLTLAWITFRRRSRELPVALQPVARLVRSGVIDALYVATYRRVAIGGARAVAWVDWYVVDGLVNFAGWLLVNGARRLRAVQTGLVQDYVWAIAAGATALAIWGLLG